MRTILFILFAIIAVAGVVNLIVESKDQKENSKDWNTTTWQASNSLYNFNIVMIVGGIMMAFMVAVST